MNNKIDWHLGRIELKQKDMRVVINSWLVVDTDWRGALEIQLNIEPQSYYGEFIQLFDANSIIKGDTDWPCRIEQSYRGCPHTILIRVMFDSFLDFVIYTHSWILSIYEPLIEHILTVMDLLTDFETTKAEILDDIKSTMSHLVDKYSKEIRNEHSKNI